MKQKRKKSSLRLKVAILISLVIVWLIIGVFSYINSPRVQVMIFASINKVSSLKIESGLVKISLLKHQF